MDNAGYLHGTHAPLLLIHGDQDVILPIKHAYKTFAEASEPKRFVKIEGAGHSDTSTRNAKLFATPILEFVKGLP